MNRAVAVVSIFLACLSVPKLCSQEKESQAKFSEKAQVDLAKRTRTIKKEIQGNTQPDWAGEYYFGDGLGVNVDLVLAPHNGFTFTWNGCLGLYDLNYGDVELKNETIKLRFKYPNDQKGFQGIAPEFRPVRWGSRHYLISADQMIDFANAINAGTEPNSGPYGSFLLKQSDREKPVDGRPELPSEYLDYLLKDPVKASVSSVGETHLDKSFRKTSITLNAGSLNGLRKGMELHVYNPSNVFATATIVGCGDHTAEAVLEQFKIDKEKPSIGWKLSTRLGDEHLASNQSTPQ